MIDWRIMFALISHFVVTCLVLGLGAGTRYIFFWMIGRRKKYEELIEPKSQDKRNIIVAIVLGVLIVYFIVEYGTHLNDRHPPVKELMKRKY